MKYLSLKVNLSGADIQAGRNGGLVNHPSQIRVWRRKDHGFPSLSPASRSARRTAPWIPAVPRLAAQAIRPPQLCSFRPVLTARTAAMVHPFEQPLEQLSRVALAKEPLACGIFVGIIGAQ